jgi:hypothetical protein
LQYPIFGLTNVSINIWNGFYTNPYLKFFSFLPWGCHCLSKLVWGWVLEIAWNPHWVWRWVSKLITANIKKLNTQFWSITMVIKKTNTLILCINTILNFFWKNQIIAYKIVSYLLILSRNPTILWSFWNTTSSLNPNVFKYPEHVVSCFRIFSNTQN